MEVHSRGNIETGWVYILSNPSYHGLVKIGVTSKLPSERAEDVATTGVPTPFIVETAFLFERNSQKIEQITHELLNDVRVSDKREFFRCSSIQAARKVVEAAEKINEPILRTNPEFPELEEFRANLELLALYEKEQTIRNDAILQFEEQQAKGKEERKRQLATFEKRKRKRLEELRKIKIQEEHLKALKSFTTWKRKREAKAHRVREAEDRRIRDAKDRDAPYINALNKLLIQLQFITTLNKVGIPTLLLVNLFFFCADRIFKSEPFIWIGFGITTWLLQLIRVKLYLLNNITHLKPNVRAFYERCLWPRHARFYYLFRR